MGLKPAPGPMRCSGFHLAGCVLLPPQPWSLLMKERSQPSLNHVSLLSAAPPSHPASTQKMSVLEGGTSVPELWYFSVGTFWLLSTSSSSLIALPSSSSLFWLRREHKPVGRMLSWSTHSSLISSREIYFVISLDTQDPFLALNLHV